MKNPGHLSGMNFPKSLCPCCSAQCLSVNKKRHSECGIQSFSMYGPFSLSSAAIHPSQMSTSALLLATNTRASSSFKQSLSRRVIDVYCVMPSLVMRTSTVETTALTIGFQRVQFCFIPRAFSTGKVGSIKRDNSQRLLGGKEHKGLNYIQSSLERAIASAQPGRTIKPRYIISAFFKLKKDVPKLLLAKAIAFFDTKPLENLGRILRTVQNAVRYQPTLRKVSKCSTERNTHER